MTTCTCPTDAAEALHRHLIGDPPEPCPAHATATEPGQHLALNDDQALAAIVGAHLSTPNN